MGSPHCPPGLDRLLGVPSSAPLDHGACPQAVSPHSPGTGRAEGGRKHRCPSPPPLYPQSWVGLGGHQGNCPGSLPLQGPSGKLWAGPSGLRTVLPWTHLIRCALSEPVRSSVRRYCRSVLSLALCCPFQIHLYTRGCHSDRSLGHLSVAETELLRDPEGGQQVRAGWLRWEGSGGGPGL